MPAKIGLGSVLNTAMPAWHMYGGYSAARTEGHTQVGSVIRGAVSSLPYALLGGTTMLKVAALQMAGPAVGTAIRNLGMFGRDINRMSRPFGSSNYFDTEQAATMRQASLQAINSSRLNARMVLGQEARLMHR